MSRRRNRFRRGSALVEFALVALVSYLLMAAILTFGSILWIGNTLQQAVDVGAQEIARMPFPPARDLGLGQIESTPPEDSVMFDSTFKARIYDERRLIVSPSDIETASQEAGVDLSFGQFADRELPLINRLLSQVYIFDNVRNVYRYPGAIVTNENGEQTVLIPIVNDGTLTWVAPVEEMRIPGTTIGPFNVVSPPGDLPPNFEPGVVALRINYPYQSASMSGFGESTGTPPHRGSIGNPIIVDDSGGDVDGNRYSLVIEDDDNAYVDEIPNIHSGRYGLGRQLALGTEVRPYRRVISVQAIYRREVFAGEVVTP